MNIVSRPGLLRNLQIGFGLSLQILIITSVASYSSISNLLDGSRWVDHTDSVIIKLDNTLSALRDAEAGPRGFLLTGDTTYLQSYNTVTDRINMLLDSIQQMTLDNTVQQGHIAELRQVVFKPIVLLGQIGPIRDLIVKIRNQGPIWRRRKDRGGCLDLFQGLN